MFIEFILDMNCFKCSRFTNKKHGAAEEQMAAKNLRMSQLRDVLHLSGLPPMTSSTTDPRNEGHVTRAAKPILEALLVKEAAYVFDIHGAAAELPRWIDADTQAVIMRRLAVLDGGIERMVRFPPHAISMQMTVVLRDRQLPHDDPECVAPVTLRATPMHHGKPRFNNVKVTVQGANRAGRRTYFGKCIAFFRDAKCNHLVLLQWYQEVGGVIDPIVGLPRLKLAPSTEPSSYDVLPAASIVNGALLVPLGTEYFALMSCRELDRHVTLNLD